MRVGCLDVVTSPSGSAVAVGIRSRRRVDGRVGRAVDRGHAVEQGDDPALGGKVGKFVSDANGEAGPAAAHEAGRHRLERAVDITGVSAPAGRRRGVSTFLFFLGPDRLLLEGVAIIIAAAAAAQAEALPHDRSAGQPSSR